MNKPILIGLVGFLTFASGVALTWLYQNNHPPGASEQDIYSDVFNDWFGSNFGDLPVSAISTREGDDRIYYEMEVGEHSVAKINVTTADGYVTIEVDLSHNEPGMISQTNINQPFPIRANADPASADHSYGVLIIPLRKLLRIRRQPIFWGSP